MKLTIKMKTIKSVMAFFFLFFLHGTSIGNGLQGISYNYRLPATTKTISITLPNQL